MKIGFSCKYLALPDVPATELKSTSIFFLKIPKFSNKTEFGFSPASIPTCLCSSLCKFKYCFGSMYVGKLVNLLIRFPKGAAISFKTSDVTSSILPALKFSTISSAVFFIIVVGITSGLSIMSDLLKSCS